LESNLSSFNTSQLKDEFDGAAEDLYDNAYECYLQHKSNEMGEVLITIHKSLKDIADCQIQNAQSRIKEKLSSLIKEFKENTISKMSKEVISQIQQIFSDDGTETETAQIFMNQKFLRLK